jgi:hypothetical protein
MSDTCRECAVLFLGAAGATRAVLELVLTFLGLA